MQTGTVVLLPLFYACLFIICLTCQPFRLPFQQKTPLLPNHSAKMGKIWMPLVFNFKIFLCMDVCPEKIIELSTRWYKHWPSPRHATTTQLTDPLLLRTSHLQCVMNCCPQQSYTENSGRRWDCGSLVPSRASRVQYRK